MLSRNNARSSWRKCIYWKSARRGGVLVVVSVCWFNGSGSDKMRPVVPGPVPGLVSTCRGRGGGSHSKRAYIYSEVHAAAVINWRYPATRWLTFRRENNHSIFNWSNCASLRVAESNTPPLAPGPFNTTHMGLRINGISWYRDDILSRANDTESDLRSHIGLNLRRFCIKNLSSFEYS